MSEAGDQVTSSESRDQIIPSETDDHATIDLSADDVQDQESEVFESGFGSEIPENAENQNEPRAQPVSEPKDSYKEVKRSSVQFAADAFNTLMKVATIKDQIKDGNYKDAREVEAAQAAEGFLAKADIDKKGKDDIEWKTRVHELSDGADAAVEILSKCALFTECSAEAMSEIHKLSKQFSLQAGESLTLKDNGELYIVTSGAVQVRVGNGEATRAGFGACFNQVGMLGLYADAEIFKPRQHAIRSAFTKAAEVLTPYESQGHSGAFPDVFKVEDPGEGKFVQPDLMALFTLCPHAFATPPSGSKDWLDCEVTALHEEGCDPPTIIVVPLHLWDDIRKKRLSMTDFEIEVRKGVDKFRNNCKVVADRWRCLLKHCASDIFPWVPPEVMWSIAELSTTVEVEPGQCLVTEGEHGEVAEAMLVIQDGSAVVEKLVGNSGVAVPLVIGKVQTGAVIGHLCYIGAAHARSATVRAKTKIQAIHIPARVLLDSLSRYPGMLERMTGRLRAATDFFSQELPTRQEVFASLRLFSSCNKQFLNSLAGNSTRTTFFCGEVVTEEDAPQGSLFVLEYGCCGVETKAHGKVNQIELGKCFGERTLLGIAQKANATVRVLSVAALVTVLPKEGLEKSLAWYPAEKERFERKRATNPDGQQNGGQVQHIELFRGCSAEFCRYLSDSVTLKGYMPQQTVVVQGEHDDPNMFVVMGGKFSVESGGKVITELTSGATFGELVMLDHQHQRGCTVRAETFGVLSEIPRSGFSAALERFPDQIQYFKDSDAKKDSVGWPCIKSASPDLLCLIDLYADQRICRNENEVWSIEESAILVVKGEVSVEDELGNDLGVLQVGECMNQHFMLGISDGHVITTLKPTIDGKVRLVSKDTFDKVLAEFPEEETSCKTQIQKYCVNIAEENLGLEPGCGEGLRLSAVFRILSAEFVQNCEKVVQNRLYTSGSQIVVPKQDEHGIYIVLSGQVSVEDRKGQHKSAVGRVFGESVMLGISSMYAYAVEAVTLCTVLFLSKAEFEDLVEEFPDDCRIISQLAHESRSHGRGDKKLVEALQKCNTFANASPEFAALLTEEMEDVFFSPNEIVFSYGEECVFGESPFYLLLAGQIYIESKLGVRLGSIKAVEVFGESAVPGIGAKRTATVMAHESGLVHCAKIPGPALERAFESFPTERERLLSLFESRQQVNEEIEARRRRWLKDVAMPALQDQPMFDGCSIQFLWALATPLQETAYKCGKAIVRFGESAHSMFLVLEGDVSMETKTGMRIGAVHEKAAIGELAMFGLLPTRTATLRAASHETRVLEVTGSALRHALSTKYAGNIVDRFKKFVKLRQEQVSLGCPLRNLDIGIVPRDVSISAVGIHAERLTFARGDVWQPIDDADPHGPHFSIIESGRAMVRMIDSQRDVMTLTAGSILADGIAHTYGARICATSKVCEVYRLRQYDFKLATAAVPSSGKWLWRFNLLENECKKELLIRLQNMNGLIEGLAPHPREEEIAAWRNTRLANIRLASQRREEGGDRLPHILRKSRSAATTKVDNVNHEALAEQVADETHAYLSMIQNKRETIARTLRPDSREARKGPGFGSGLLAYPSFHLPIISSKAGKSTSTLQTSQSETTFRSSPLSETGSRSS